MKHVAKRDRQGFDLLTSAPQVWDEAFESGGQILKGGNVQKVVGFLHQFPIIMEIVGR
jgi:hypothetical protein